MFKINSNFFKNKEKQAKIKQNKPKTKKTKEQIKQKNEEKRQFLKDKNEFEQKFYRLMLELGLYNKFNRTYWLRIIEKTNYGFYAQLYLVDGLSFSKFKENIGVIQENLQCIWIMKTEQFRDYADLKIVLNPLDEDIKYENPKIKPWHMYIGLGFTLTPIINKNVNEICNFLFSGATRSGKTRFIYQVLLSWILSCTPEEVSLYLTDIAKDEYINFENIKHVKWYANDLDKLHSMMLFLDKELDRRKLLISKIRKKGLGTTIVDYNKINGIKKLSYSYILIDELSIIMPDNTDSKAEKEIKQEILDIIKRIEKTGAGMGLFILAATQKTSKDEMIPIIKNMSALRLSFRANDRPSSEVVMGDSSAVGLAKRYAVYSFNGGEEKDYLFSPYLDMKMVSELLEPYYTDEFKANRIKNNSTVQSYELPKQITKYNPDANIDNKNIIWKINIKLKEYKGGFENIKTPKVETKLVALKGGNFVDY